jgi:hypothetical protein
MPDKSTVPNLGKKCGRRERESRREGRREQSLREHHSFACVAVKDIPVYGKTALLRGTPSERGPGSVRSCAAVSSVACDRADDSGCPKNAEEGNVVRLRAQGVGSRRRHERSSHAHGDASFTRSFDPCTSILTMLHGESFGGGASIRHHGWANLGNREEPTLGLG